MKSRRISGWKQTLLNCRMFPAGAREKMSAGRTRRARAGPQRPGQSPSPADPSSESMARRMASGRSPHRSISRARRGSAVSETECSAFAAPAEKCPESWEVAVLYRPSRKLSAVTVSEFPYSGQRNGCVPPRATTGSRSEARSRNSGTQATAARADSAESTSQVRRESRSPWDPRSHGRLRHCRARSAAGQGR